MVADTGVGTAADRAAAAGGPRPGATPAAEDAELVDVALPAMGESVTEGTVLEWHVQVGDAVQEGDTVVEVSTDKVDTEVPAPASGVLAEILVGPDETAPVGAPLGRIAAGQTTTPAPAEPPADDGAPALARPDARARSPDAGAPPVTVRSAPPRSPRASRAPTGWTLAPSRARARAGGS